MMNDRPQDPAPITREATSSGPRPADPEKRAGAGACVAPAAPDDEWLRFFDATAHREPRDMLRKGLACLAADCLPPGRPAVRRRGLDLGCGSGHEAVAMATEGGFAEVVAVDFHPEAVRRTLALAADRGVADRVRGEGASLEAFVFPEGTMDLVHAGFTLPFVAPEAFDRVWRSIRRALRPAGAGRPGEDGGEAGPGGIFAGQFFGVRDEWAQRPLSETRARNFFDRAQVEAMLADGWTVLHLDEVEKDGQTATGNAKHWHVFHLVLRRTDALDHP